MTRVKRTDVELRTGEREEEEGQEEISRDISCYQATVPSTPQGSSPWFSPNISSYSECEEQVREREYFILSKIKVYMYIFYCIV